MNIEILTADFMLKICAHYLANYNFSKQTQGLLATKHIENAMPPL